jgi:triacylglycerol esterase/lipase EstA (alpha/beta hydrolase family)
VSVRGGLPSVTVRLGAAVLLVIALGASSASAEARDPGPRLTTPARALKAALKCQQSAGGRDPVLLVHGTAANPTIAWAAGLRRLLSERGYVVCTVALPDGGTGRIGIAAEYVVASIRRMAARFDRPVNVVGHRQGGMLPRWAIKWWPDIRSLVGDVVGLAPSNHGSSVAMAVCASPCPAAFWQQGSGSRFLAALNDGDETPGRLSYSVVSSQTDTTVPPPSPELRGEADDSNTAIQAICPGREVSHTQILYDAVSVALVVDALTHVGPARASRLPAGVCERELADGTLLRPPRSRRRLAPRSSRRASALPSASAQSRRSRSTQHGRRRCRARCCGSAHTEAAGGTASSSGRWALPVATAGRFHVL